MDHKMTLVIKNFGPIKDLRIQLNRFVVLIGESGSGKSIIMRTASLIKFIYKKMYYKQLLKKSGIKKDPFRFVLPTLLRASELDDFWRDDSFVEFFIENKSIIKLENKKVSLNYDNLEKNMLVGKIAMINDFRHALPELLKLNRNLPFLIDDMAINFRKAVEEFGKFELSSLNLKLFKQGRGFFIEYLLENQDYKVKLNHSSSGEKNVSVMEVICDYFAKRYNFNESIKNAVGEFISSNVGFENFEKLSKYLSNNEVKTFLNLFIEEPESNLFPAQQKKVTSYLVSLLKEKNKPDIMISTHSPYILTSLNNLLFAGQLYADKKVDKNKLKDIIPQKYKLNPSEFNAYLVKNGALIDLIDKESGLIRADKIDEISTQIADEFDTLLSLKDFNENWRF